MTREPVAVDCRQFLESQNQSNPKFEIFDTCCLCFLPSHVTNYKYLIELIKILFCVLTE